MRREVSLHRPCTPRLPEVVLLHSEAITGLPDRDSEPCTPVQRDRNPGDSHNHGLTAVPLRFRAKPPRPIRSHRGPVVVFGVLLLIAVIAKFSMSFLKMEAAVLLRSGFSVLAVLMAVYVAALIAVAVVIERRRRARSRLQRQPVIE